jgi:hypothetical protein
VFEITLILTFSRRTGRRDQADCGKMQLPWGKVEGGKQLCLITGRR